MLPVLVQLVRACLNDAECVESTFTDELGRARHIGQTLGLLFVSRDVYSLLGFHKAI